MAREDDRERAERREPDRPRRVHRSVRSRRGRDAARESGERARVQELPEPVRPLRHPVDRGRAAAAAIGLDHPDRSVPHDDGRGRRRDRARREAAPGDAPRPIPPALEPDDPQERVERRTPLRVGDHREAATVECETGAADSDAWPEE